MLKGVQLCFNSGYVRNSSCLDHLFEFLTKPDIFGREVFFPIFRQCCNHGAWTDLFAVADVEWIISFLNIDSITISTSRRRGVQLPGLCRVTFYLPWRCLRQAGQLQRLLELHELPVVPCTTYEIGSVEALRASSRVWQFARMLPALSVLEDDVPTASYTTWLLEDLEGDA